MEFENVSEEVKREARRFAAAFGVEKWERKEESELHVLLVSRAGSHKVGCSICHTTGHIEEIGVVKDDLIALLFVDRWDGRQEIVEFDRVLPDDYDFMVRGLHCLGYKDEEVLSQLPPLTAHERMELRLSMPREFWPQKWLDEEAAN
ncbi:hypothetical protein EON83_29695 [bacterium]|nr:MAG: hypothetical protein EON83_29695 [bacterium]